LIRGGVGLFDLACSIGGESETGVDFLTGSLIGFFVRLSLRNIYIRKKRDKRLILLLNRTRSMFNLYW
jgi:hypothetical protein